MTISQIDIFAREVYDLGKQRARLCPDCRCLPGYVAADCGHAYCETCGNSGFVGVDGELDPTLPCGSLPGSDEKVVAMCVRYSRGVDLWNPEDCRDDSRKCVPALMDEETTDADED